MCYKALFVAAEMDGASHFQQVINIVIPMSGPIIGTLAILSFLHAWNDFLLPLIILRDKELFTLGVGLIYLDGEYVKPWGRIMASYFLGAIPLDPQIVLSGDSGFPVLLEDTDTPAAKAFLHVAQSIEKAFHDGLDADDTLPIEENIHPETGQLSIQ